MKTKGRRVSKNMYQIDPASNARDYEDYKKDQSDKRKVSKMIMEDRADISPYLRSKEPLAKAKSHIIDDMQNSMNNRYPEEKATRLRTRRETYPAQKMKKSDSKNPRSPKGAYIQVTPGKWKSTNTWSVE